MLICLLYIAAATRRRRRRRRGISLVSALALRRIARSTTLAISLHLTLSGRTRRANSIKGSEIRTKKRTRPALLCVLQGVSEVRRLFGLSGGSLPARIFPRQEATSQTLNVSRCVAKNIFVGNLSEVLWKT